MENGNNLDIDFLYMDYNSKGWDSQDWTLPFTNASAP